MIYQRRPHTATPSTSTPASGAVAPRRLEHDLSNNHNGVSLPPSDPVLDFGLSVEVCDDSRRAVEKDMKELNSANTSTRDEIAKENRVSQQLNMDLTHSDAEMKNTNRKATDLLESTGLQDHLLQPLAGTLLVEIVAPVSSTSYPKTGIDPNQSNEDANASTILDKDTSISSVFDEHRDAIKKRAEVIKDRKESCQRLYNKLCATEKEHHRMSQNTEGMEEELGKVQKTAKESESVLESEKRRNLKYSEALDNVRSNCAKWTDDGDKLANEFACKRQANLATENDLEQQEQVATKEYDEMMNSVSAQEAEQAQLNQELEKLTRALAECELLHAQKEDKALEKQSCFQQSSNLQNKEEEAVSQLTAAAAKYEEAEEQLGGLTNAEAAFAAEKLENDTLYEENLVADKTEMAELSKEKEQLVILIDEMQEEIAAHKKKIDEAVANIKESQEVTEENLKTVQAEIESMRQTRAEVKQDNEKSTLNVLTELEEVETLARQIEEKNESEQKRISDLKVKQSEGRQKLLCEANETIDREHNDLKQVRDVLAFTKEHLKKTSAEKERILSTLA